MTIRNIGIGHPKEIHEIQGEVPQKLSRRKKRKTQQISRLMGLQKIPVTVNWPKSVHGLEPYKSAKCNQLKYVEGDLTDSKLT